MCLELTLKEINIVESGVELNLQKAIWKPNSLRKMEEDKRFIWNRYHECQTKR